MDVPLQGSQDGIVDGLGDAGRIGDGGLLLGLGGQGCGRGEENSQDGAGDPTM
jgi:hypothetical protein